MKVRQGFISNSSSSSFIIGLPKHPENILELHDMVFGTQFVDIRTYGDAYSSACFAKTIFDDVNNKYNQISPPLFGKQLTARIVEEISHGYFDGYPERPYDYYRLQKSYQMERDFKNKYDIEIYLASKLHPRWYNKWIKTRDKEWKEENKLILEAAKEYWNKHKDKFKGLKIYIVEYSDNDGDYYSTMEHGDIFNKIPHFRISHH